MNLYTIEQFDDEAPREADLGFQLLDGRVLGGANLLLLLLLESRGVRQVGRYRGRPDLWPRACWCEQTRIRIVIMAGAEGAS